MNKGGFSIYTLGGLTSMKRKASRSLGVPLTKTGRRQKLGNSIFKIFK